jgi:signal transduction histidine kinase
VLFAQEHAARERAEAADQRKDEMVASVSHELRGPLSVIGGWVDLLSDPERKPDPATLAKALGAMGRGVKLQERLIADLLDLSRIAFGDIRLARDPLDLVAIADATIESVRAEARAKDIHLELSGGHAGSVVLGDAGRIHQVLWNLLFNAVKFTPKGGHVRTMIAGVGTGVEVRVSDTGEGIAPEVLPHLFDGVRRADANPAHRKGGLGLGLRLVRELVELHGGSVRAESAGLGRGSTFTIVFPKATALPEDSRRTQKTES